jgi:subtilisin family serine protease
MPENQSAYAFTALTEMTGSAQTTALDPRLQKMIAFRHQGMRKSATASTDSDEVAVLARVTDVTAWEGLSEVRPGVVIGDRDADGVSLVTARIPISRIEFVRTQPLVQSLKAAQRLRPALAATTSEILSRPNLLPAGSRAQGGKGVLVGIVDFGCDFAHRNFITTNGKTRLRKIWNQNDTASTGPFGYGRVFTAAQINAALPKPNPYTALGYDIEAASHGTHVMDIAAGNGRGTGVPGVAPNAELIFVELASSDIPWGGPAAVGKSFGDSVQLLEAIQFIFNEAGTMPCVVNASLGTNGGPHDGSTLVEQGIDRLLRQKPNRAMVIAAANSFADNIHAAGNVPQNGQFDLAWPVPLGDFTDNELEIWYPGNAQLSVELFTPSGDSVGVVAPGQSGTVNSGGQVLLFIANRLNDPNNHDNMIGIFLSENAPKGNWKVRLHGDASRAVNFHAWIERDDDGQTGFPVPADNSHTLGSISCGQESIVVGSYDAHKPALPLSFFSSAGPTRDGRQKPEISAPGHAVVAARSRSKTGATNMSGTSMAAPAVSGAVALLLAEAKARNKSLTIREIRTAVIGAARSVPPPAGAWHARYGNGRVSAAGMLKTLTGATPPIAGTAAMAAGAKRAAKKQAAKPATKKTTAKPAAKKASRKR